MTDPHLIIYNPVLTLDGTTIVTNGDQTNTIYDFMIADRHPGYNFEAVLATRTGRPTGSHDFVKKIEKIPVRTLQSKSRDQKRR